MTSFSVTNRSVRGVAYGIVFASLAMAGPVIAEEVTYLHADALGSPIAATDENGTLLWEERYEPFGERFYEPAAASSNRRSFTGHAEDASGLIYMGARYYNAEIGRFYSADPGPLFAAGPGFVNRYAYVANAPGSGIDPDGRAIETVWDVASFGYGLYSFRNNVNRGDFAAAGDDAIGVVGDGLAIALPFVPGGVSLAIQAQRAARVVAAAGDAADAGRQIGRVTEALSRIKSEKGNFNIGHMTRSELDEVGIAWVGPKATPMLSKNGVQIGWSGVGNNRHYRFPDTKNHGRAAGTTQGNLTENVVRANGKVIEIRNAHVDLLQ